MDFASPSRRESPQSPIADSRRGDVRTQDPTFSPSLLAREALVQESKHFCDVELDVLEIEVLLTVLLHFEEIVEFEVELQQASIPTCSTFNY